MASRDRERLTVSNVAVGLTAEKIASKRYAMLRCIGNNLRVTFDGTTPVASTTGHPMLVGDVIELVGLTSLQQFKAIRDGGSDGSLECFYASDSSVRSTLLPAGAVISGDVLIDGYFPEEGALGASGVALPTSTYMGAIAYKHNGATLDIPRMPSIFTSLNAVTIATAQDAVTPTSGKKVRLLGFHLSSSTAISIVFRNKTGNVVLLRTPVLAAAGVIQGKLGEKGILLNAANDILEIIGSATGVVSGWIETVEE